MAFRFALLGSGSRGNATVVEAGATRVLVDCGFPVRELDARARQIELDPASLSGILVTHEHGDHIGGVARLARAYELPVYLTRGTASARSDWTGCTLHYLSPHEAFTLGALSVQPFPVPHDAREPCQFAFAHAGLKLGIVSDLGRATAHVQRSLDACDALLLECNHDPALLAASAYPASLKARVAGPLGHLANELAAQLLERCRHPRLRHVVAAHLSRQNNRPALAAAALAGVLGTTADDIVVADANDGFGWLALR